MFTPFLDRLDLLLQLVDGPASRPAIVIFVGVIELLEIACQSLITRQNLSFQLGLGEVPILVVHRLQSGAVDSQEFGSEQIQFPAKDNELAKYLTKRFPVGARRLAIRLE